MEETGKMTHPQLRPVEAFPVQHEGESFVCLRDPAGLADQPIFLNGVLTLLVSMMDGSKSLRDIQAEFFRKTGEILEFERLEEVVRQLDQFRYLESPSFRSYHEELVAQFRSASVRPAVHAGSAYESNPDALRQKIDTFFEPPDGPGPIDTSGSNSPLRGLVSPHIDFHRGGPGYGFAYKALAENPGATRFIIFGTCHNVIQQRFALTEKDYDTPLGPARNARDFVKRLSGHLSKNYFLDEFAHRGEHSIEFQAICLKYLFGNREDLEIVPILVGSFHDIFLSDRRAADDPDIQEMVDAIRKTMRELPAGTCIIAGADLAHVGRRFGDAGGLSITDLERVEREDRRFLSLVESGEAEAVFQSIADDHDRRRVCGYPPIYMTLRCLAKTAGRLLQYRQWSDLETSAAVTYASLALF